MDFVIVGPEKTATGWLDAAIRQRAPASLPSVTKETFYLDRLYHLGPRWHAKLYQGEAKVRGEVSPSYFARPVTRTRLRGINAQARVVVVLRDPYVRMASHLLHIMRRGVGNLNTPGLGLSQAQWSEARESSLYRRHGEAWRAALGRDNVLFVLYDDIKRAPAALLRRIGTHIGVDLEVDDSWAVAFSTQRVFEGASPTNPGFSQAAYAVSRGLQALGATRLVAAARRSGIRKLVERKHDAHADDVRIDLERRLLTQEVFEREIDYAEDRLGADLTHWRAASKLNAAMPFAAQSAQPSSQC